MVGPAAAPARGLRRRVWARPGFEPWNLRLLEAADGELVGATHVTSPGTRVRRPDRRPPRPPRARLAGAMLVDAFGLAREHGAVRSYLSTDTRAGARGALREGRHGRHSTWVNRAIDL